MGVSGKCLAGVGFLTGSHRNAIRSRDRLLPVRADVFRNRTPCGRAEARPYEKNLADVFRLRSPCGRVEARPYGKNLPVRSGKCSGATPLPDAPTRQALADQLLQHQPDEVRVAKDIPAPEAFWLEPESTQPLETIVG